MKLKSATLLAAAAAAVLSFALPLRAETAPAAPELLFEDKLEKTEGLALCPDGRLFVAEQSGRISEIIYGGEKDELKTFHEGLDLPAGLACGANGKLYALEYKAGNVVEISPDGKSAKKVASGFKSLNAAAVKSDGTIFVSESDAGKISTVNPADGTVTLLTGGVMYANGLVLSLDEKTLYAASTTGGKVYSIPLEGDSKGKKKLFKDQLQMVDGLASDADGNLFACLFASGKAVRILKDGTVQLLAEGMKSAATPVYVDMTVTIPEKKNDHKYAYLYITNLGGKGIYKAAVPQITEEETK